MREAKIIQRDMGEQTTVVQAIEPAGIMVLSVIANELTLQEQVAGVWPWSISGIDGIFIDDNYLFFVGLSRHGLQHFFFKYSNLSTSLQLDKDS
jgi:hypothetical protein